MLPNLYDSGYFGEGDEEYFDFEEKEKRNLLEYPEMTGERWAVNSDMAPTPRRIKRKMRYERFNPSEYYSAENIKRRHTPRGKRDLVGNRLPGGSKRLGTVATDPFDRWGKSIFSGTRAVGFGSEADVHGLAMIGEEMAQKSGSRAERFDRQIAKRPEESTQQQFDRIQAINEYENRLSPGVKREIATSEKQGLSSLDPRTDLPTAGEYIQKKHEGWAKGIGDTPPIFTGSKLGTVGDKSGDAVYQAHKRMEKERQKKIKSNRRSMDMYVKNNKDKFKEYLLENRGKYSQAVRDYLTRNPEIIEELFR